MCRISSRVLVAACLVLLGASAWSAAHATVPAEIPQRGKDDFVCENIGAKYYVTRRKLLPWVADHYSLRRACAVTDAQILDVLSNPDVPNCTEKDRDRIGDARVLLSSLLADENRQHFKVSGSQNLLSDDYMDVLDSFLNGPGARSIECLKAEKKEESTTPGTGAAIKLPDLKIGTWQVKLRQDQNSLEPDRAQKEAFKKAKSAQFSITDDQLSDQTRYDVKAAIGIDSGKVNCGRDSRCRVIPYVKWEHARTTPKAAKNDSDKTTYGALAIHSVAPRDLPFSWHTTFDVQYIVDEKGLEPTEILAGTVKLRSAFTLPSGMIIPGKAQEIAGLLLFSYDFGGVLRYGEALESGGNPVFDKQKTFMYSGGDIDVWFMGLENTMLERLRLQLYYSYLVGNRGLFDELSYFNATLTYALDKDGYFDINLSYANGREYETFERSEVWKTSFGYKF